MEVPKHWRLGKERKNPTGKDCPGGCETIILQMKNTCGDEKCNGVFLQKNLNQGSIYIAADTLTSSIPAPVEQVQG